MILVGGVFGDGFVSLWFDCFFVRFPFLFRCGEIVFSGFLLVYVGSFCFHVFVVLCCHPDVWGLRCFFLLFPWATFSVLFLSLVCGSFSLFRGGRYSVLMSAVPAPCHCAAWSRCSSACSAVCCLFRPPCPAGSFPCALSGDLRSGCLSVGRFYDVVAVCGRF
ncbi:hypothetical protein AE51_01966 [Escherichia coli BIDMC 76]|nr:hypothetical protein AE51_01966 [Escherichia coli BIDMC 76]